MLKGTGVSAGVSFAQVVLWDIPQMFEAPKTTLQPEIEHERFEKALDALKQKNSAVRQKTARRFGDSEAAIFDAYHMMLSDEEGLLEPVRQSILSNKHSAENAVRQKFDQLAEQFLKMESEYMRERAEDIHALRDQIIREMQGVTLRDMSHFDEATIVVATTLSPADIAGMDLSRLEGIVCETGGYSSHTAIIVRTLGIPAVFGIDRISEQVHSGDTIALDGETGEVWLNPGEQEISTLRERSTQVLERRKIEKLYHGLPTITKDGHRVQLATNVGQLAEVDTALESDAEAIGLYRTELLHVNRLPLASEEEEFLTYRCLLEKAGGKSVTVRTFDDGGNTGPIPIKGGNKEFNPVLGFRGIRLSMERPNFFRSQVRALLRASAYGDLKVMLPMITTIDEFIKVHQRIEECKMELSRERIEYDEKMPVGVMIETPASAIMAKSLSHITDFLSIGINDLLQFVLAIDRTNPRLTHMYHLFHPSVLRLVRDVVNGAHEQGVPCYICGDIPFADEILPVLLGIGVDGFSMNPRLVLPARRTLNNCNYLECYRLAGEILALDRVEDVRMHLGEYRTLQEQAESSFKEQSQMIG